MTYTPTEKYRIAVNVNGQVSTGDETTFANAIAEYKDAVRLNIFAGHVRTEFQEQVLTHNGNTLWHRKHYAETR